jgi:hypothetical protein
MVGARTTRRAAKCSCNICISKNTGRPLKRLRVALCLFGQPRRFKEGYDVFMKWLKAPHHSNIDVDVFFHSWFMKPVPGEKISYTTSQYRTLGEEDTLIQEGTIDQLKQLYNPVAYAEDKPIEFDENIYVHSLLYKRTNELGHENANNTLSQQYSRQKVRDLVMNHSKGHGIKYDFIIGSRFDFINPITVNINELNPTKVHLTDCRFPRKHLPDPLIICNQRVFMKLFNVYNNLRNIINNNTLAKHFVKTCKELYIFHPEEILHMNYIYYFHDNSAFEYHTGIPNFHK